jgi:hypothetical protein
MKTIRGPGIFLAQFIAEQSPAQFVTDHIIRLTPRAFDDFAASADDDGLNRRLPGLDSGG